MKRYAIYEIPTKKKIICDTGSINMCIWADEVYCFTDFSSITSYEFRFHIKVSNSVCMLNFNSKY